MGTVPPDQRWNSLSVSDRKIILRRAFETSHWAHFSWSDLPARIRHAVSVSS